MQSIRQVANAILIAFASLILVVGGISLSLAEGGFTAIPVKASEATVTPPPSMTPTQLAATLGEMTATITPTFTLTPSLAVCAPPEGWVAVLIQPGQTLETTAIQYNLSVASILQANCLQSAEGIAEGTMIYVIPKPSQPVPTLPQCGPPAGWIVYIVRPGDTQYSIATRYRITVAQLRFANCLSSSLIITGSKLYVPNVATSTPFATPPGILTLTFTPSPTSTNTLTPTATTETPLPPTDTDTPVPPTETETSTPVTATP